MWSRIWVLREGPRRLLTLGVLSLVLVTGSAIAQIGFGLRRSPADSLPSTVSPGSPRAAVLEYLRLAEAGDWTGASDFLAVGTADRARAALLARRLKTVLDQRVALDPRTLSPLAVGDTTDGDVQGDRVAVLLSVAGREEPVRLVRVPGNPSRWLFASTTVARVDAWYAALGSPWLRDRLPQSLQREGPLNVYWWQWIGLAALIPLVLALSWLIGALLRNVFGRIAARTLTTWDDVLLEHLRGPFRLWAAALIAEPLLSVLQLNPRVASFVEATARGLLLIAIFWGLLRIIRLGQERIELAADQHGQGAQARTLVPLFGNILRVTLAVVALLVALAQFGYPVGTLLAGLGIGGIAVALAAQKTVEHLFGSVSLASDRAFRVGDWVRAGTTEGAVERIGLRSTSIRTIDRTVVRVPNGRLADERIETFGERDRILLRTDLDVPYDTSPEQLTQVRDAIEAALRAHPRIWPDVVRVHVVAFTESAIRFNIQAWFLTTDWNEFLMIRHTLYLEFLRIVRDAGTSFAFPSRTIYHVPVGDGTPPPPPITGE
ncbi:MAG: mechanosensitive ion channel family protein [Gemmatimonadetes bacterium]|nr:mechanosensitive ion channel family protein [Gemmatimonadota bacterium]